MKKLGILFTFILLVQMAFAQDYYDDEVKTLFSNSKSNGWYGAFSMGYSQIDGHDALISGARGVFIFDHKFGIGMGGYGLVNNLDYHSYTGESPDPRFMLAGGYGGLILEPVVASKQAVHVSFPVLIGMGGVALLENNGWGWDWNFDPYYPNSEYDNDVFFVIEPAVELEFNLTRWFRTAAYVSYRFTSDIEMYETDSDVLNGFNFGMTFKFGKLH